MKHSITKSGSSASLFAKFTQHCGAPPTVIPQPHSPRRYILYPYCGTLFTPLAGNLHFLRQATHYLQRYEQTTSPHLAAVAF